MSLTTTPERRRQTQKKWRRKNPNYVMKWRAANPEKVKAAYKRHYEKHREKLKLKRAKFRVDHPDYDRIYLRKIRKKVLKHYGGKCKCCGESRFEFLAFDHIRGNGAEHRREIKRYGSAFVRWLIRNKYPEGFRVLCHCCNLALGFYGYCPHKRRKTQ